MISRSFAPLFLLLTPTKLLAPAAEGETIRPHGWIGTTEEWARGLGIASSTCSSWWQRGDPCAAEERPRSPRSSFIAIAVLPLAVVCFSYSYGLEKSKSVEASEIAAVLIPSDRQ